MNSNGPGNGFSEEFKRQFMKDSGIDRFIESQREQLSETFQPIIDRQQEQIRKQLQPLVLQATKQAAEALKPLHSIGADMAKQVAASIDYSTVYKSVAERNSVKVSDEVKIEPVVDDVTEERLDALVEETFANHPDLREAIDSDPEVAKLSEYQKKMFKWGAVLTFVFGMLVTGGLVSQSEEATQVIETVSISLDVGDMVLATRGAVMKRKKKDENESDSDDEEED